MKPAVISSSSMQKAVITFMLLMVSTSAWCIIDFTTLMYPPWGKFPIVVVHDSIYHNIDSLAVTVEIDELDRDFGGTGVYYNTVSLSDTNYFQYVGNVVPDSTDSVGSVLYCYRFIYTGYSYTPGSVLFFDLLSIYKGEYYDDNGSLSDDCMPFNSCPGKLYSNALYPNIIGLLPYEVYTNDFAEMSTYNQQVVTTLFNWVINNSTPQIADYAALFDASSGISSTIPTNFCEEQYAGNCAEHHLLLDSLKELQQELIAIGPDSFPAFDSIVQKGAVTFLFNCFNQTNYFIGLTSIDIGSGYLITATPYQAGRPEIVAAVVFDDDTTYTPIAYSYNWNYSDGEDFAMHYAGDGIFTYINGFHKAFDGEFDNPFPVLLKTINASGPLAFCAGDSVVLSISPTAVNPHWSTGDTVNNAIRVDTTGYFTAYDVDTEGCRNNTDTIIAVVMHALPTPTITPNDTLIVSGQSITFTATGGVTYRWPGSFGDSDIANVLLFTDSTLYPVTAIDSFGCRGSAESFVRVIPAPVLSVVSYSDTIESGDTTNIEIFSSLENASFSWVRDMLDTIEGPITDTTRTVKIALINNSGGDQKVLFHIQAFTPAYGIQETTQEVVVKSKGLESITVTPTMPSFVACTSAVCTLVVHRNGTSPEQFGIQITPNVTGGGTLPLSAISNIRIQGVALPTGTYAVTTGTTAILIHPTGTNSFLSDFTITYDLMVPCDAIPTSTSTTSFITQNIDVTKVDGTAWLPGDGVSYRIGAAAISTSETVSSNWDHPVLDLFGSTSQTFTLGVTDVQVIEVTYKNNSIYDFHGDISFDGSFGCSGILDVTHIEISDGSGGSPYTVDNASTLAHSAVVPAGELLVVDVTVKLADCIPADPGQCTSDFSLNYSCTGQIGSCHWSAFPMAATIKQIAGIPYVIVSRVLEPSEPSGDGHGYAWDATCMSKVSPDISSNSQDWSYLIINKGDAVAKNVYVDLTSVLGTYSLIDYNSISLSPNASPFTPTSPAPASLTDYAIDPTALLSSETASHCYSDITALGTGHYPIKEYGITIPLLYPGQNILLSFSTIRCCPYNADFGDPINFNRWKLIVTYENCGEEKQANLGLTPSQQAWLHQTYGGTPTYLAFNPDNITDAYIASEVQPGTPDLSLYQEYMHNVDDLLGVTGDCGEAQTFKIANHSFTAGDANGDYDTQLFSSDPIAGPNGPTGQNPSGIFQFDIQFTNGMSFAGTPTISNHGITWSGTVTSLSSTSKRVTFDIAGGTYVDDATSTTLSNPVWATAFDFKNFFKDSYFNFDLKTCCPLPEGVSVGTVSVETSFNPLASSSCAAYPSTNYCMIKLNSLSFGVNLHCPGCEAPGIILDKFELVRTNFGYEDAQNAGLPDGTSLAAIDPATYSQKDHLVLNGSIVGDNIQATAHAFFEDGDPSKTFGYVAWQDYWETLTSVRPQITDWYLQQQIDNGYSLGLKCVGATLEYKNHISGTWSSAFALSAGGFTISTSHPAAVDANDRILFHVDLSSAFSGYDIQPSDEFRLIAQYEACVNPSVTTDLHLSQNYMFLTLAPLSPSSPNNPFHDYATVFGIDNGTTPGESYFDPSNSTNSHALFYCDAFGLISATHHVYPIVSDYSEVWDDENGCGKSATLKGGYHIANIVSGHSYRNVFPYEYRLLPGINPSDLPTGPVLTTTDPTTFHFTVPHGYKATFNKAYTEAMNYTYPNTPTLLLTQDQTFGDLISSSGSSAEIDAISSSVSFDIKADLSKIEYRPPFRALGYTIPNAYPYPFQTLTSGGKTIWLIGDENFMQDIIFDIAPICSTSVTDPTIISPGAEKVTIPDFANACATPTDLALQDVSNHSISRPNINIQAGTNSPYFTFHGNEISCTFTIHTNGYQANGNPLTAENLFFYLDKTALATAAGSTLSFISLQEITASSPFVYNTISSSGDFTNTTNSHVNSLFEVGSINNTVRTFVLTLSLSNCDLANTLYTIPFYYSWSCDGYPEDNMALWPGTNACASPQSAGITVDFPLVDASTTLEQVDPAQTCGTQYKACFKSLNLGGINTVTGNIILPNVTSHSLALNFDQVEITTFSGTTPVVNTYTPSSGLLSSAINTTSPPTLKWTFNLADYTDPTAYNDGITNEIRYEDEQYVNDNDLNSGEQVCVYFTIDVPCRKSDFTPALPDLSFEFSGKSYCNTTITRSNSPALAAVSPLNNGCGPNITLSNGPCWGGYSISTTGGNPNTSGSPYTYSWSPTEPSVSTPTPGDYTVTATDHDGCEDVKSFTINTPFTLSNVHTTSICTASQTGYIKIIPQGGTSPYQYSWGPGLNTQVRTGLGAGTYHVTVTDALACSVSASITIGNSGGCCSGQTNYHAGTWIGNLTFENYTSTELTALLGNPLNIGGNQISFNGTFTVDNNYTISNCSRVTFAAAAKVDIQAPYSLTIVNSNLYACDNALWEGIDVNAFASLNILKNSSISDALYAAHLFDGAKFGSNSCTYSNNFVGVYFDPIAILGTPFNTHVTLLAPIISNSFVGTANLKPIGALTTSHDIYLTQPPTSQVDAIRRPWAGMHLDVLSSFTSGSINQSVYGNYFQNLANGIVARDCNLSSLNDRFSNIQPFGYNYTNNGLKFQGNGILAYDQYLPSGAALKLLTLRGKNTLSDLSNTFTSMYGCQTGVFGDHINVAASQYTIFSSPGSNTNEGVHIQNSALTKIYLHQLFISSQVAGINLLHNDPALNISVVNNEITIGFYTASVWKGLKIQELNYIPYGSAIYDHNTIKPDENGQVGADINTCAGFHFTNNHIRVYENKNRSFYYGLWISNSNKFRDANNRVFDDGHNEDTPPVFRLTQTAINYPVGYLYINNWAHWDHGGTTAPNIHECDTVQNIYTGVMTSMVNLGSYMTGMCFNPDAQIYPTYPKMGIGYFVKNTASIEQETNAGNKWFGSTDNNTYASLWARNDNVTAQIQAQRYFTSDALPYLPSLFTDGWFVPRLGTEFSCGSTIHVNPCSGCPHLSTFEDIVINHQLHFALANPELIWQNERAVYSKLRLLRDSIMPNTAEDTFFQDKQASNTETIILMDSLKSLSRMVDTAFLSFWSTSMDYRDSLLGELLKIDSIVTSDSTETYTKWNPNISTLNEAVANVEIMMDSMMSISKGQRNLKIAEALSLNAGLTSENVPVDNIKKFNDIYFNTYAIDTFGFDSIQLATLYDLAFQCPYTGGEAVFEARSLLAEILDTLYIDEQNCSSPSYKKDEPFLQAQQSADSVNRADKELKAKLYPNPTKDYAILMLNEISDQPFQLKVMDAMGRMLIDQKISMAAGIYKIETSQFSSGIYFVSLTNNEEMVYNGRLSVMKR